MTDNARVASSIAAVLVAAGMMWHMLRQCRRPTGWLGRRIVGIMNRSHAGLISWGLEHVQVHRHDSILDVGCGGGLTVQRLAKMADLGKVHGVDYSAASVAASHDFNRAGIAAGGIGIQRATVSCLPFSNDAFELVTAVETHYYWPDLASDVREIWRVLKPGGRLLIMAEVYRSPGAGRVGQLAMKPLGGAVLSPDEHRNLLTTAGYSDVQVSLEPAKGWICVRGRKLLTPA